jgi:alkylation response protein AidB-like acyl-CoA dehydrogenase
MDFEVSDDQLALQEGIGQFCAGRLPPAAARHFGEPGGFDHAAWAELAQLGTFGINLSEESGGVGLAAIDAVLVYEVLGAGLVPGPVVAATLAAAVLPDADAAAVLSGTLVPAVIDLPSETDPADSPLLVEHLPDAGVLLVIADDGVHVVDPATTKAARVEEPLDPTASLARVDDLPAGDVIAGPEASARLRTLGSVLTSALLIGIATATTKIAVAYAKDRSQFGRPIGSFQGLQFMLADAHARTEIARASLHAAGLTVDDPDIGDIERAVAGARVLAAHAAVDNAGTCIQTHGGIGFTWEFDAHLYLKRAWVLSTAFGTPDDAAEIVARRLVADP